MSLGFKKNQFPFFGFANGFGDFANEFSEKGFAELTQGFDRGGHEAVGFFNGLLFRTFGESFFIDFDKNQDFSAFFMNQVFAGLAEEIRAFHQSQQLKTLVEDVSGRNLVADAAFPGGFAFEQMFNFTKKEFRGVSFFVTFDLKSFANRECRDCRIFIFDNQLDEFADVFTANDFGFRSCFREFNAASTSCSS